MDRNHLVRQKDLDAGLSGRRREGMHEAVAGGHGRALVRCGRLAGLDQRPIHRRRVHFARHRVPHRAAAQRIGRLVDEHDAMRHEEFIGRRAIVGECADHLAVVEAVIGKAVGLHDRPVGQVLEDEVRGILDAPFLLIAGAAAERDIAAAADRMATRVTLRLDEDHRRTGLPRDDRRGKPRRARADHDDVGLPMPAHGGLPRLRFRLGDEAAGGQAGRHPGATQKHVAPLDRHVFPPSVAGIVIRMTHPGRACDPRPGGAGGSFYYHAAGRKTAGAGARGLLRSGSDTSLWPD